MVPFAYGGVVVTSRNVAKVDRVAIRNFTTKSVVCYVINGDTVNMWALFVRLPSINELRSSRCAVMYHLSFSRCDVWKVALDNDVP